MATSMMAGDEAFEKSEHRDLIRNLLYAAYEGSTAANEHFIDHKSSVGEALTAVEKDAALSAIIKDAGLGDSGYRDLLTKADKASQAAIKAILNNAYPEIRITSEEDATTHDFKEGDVRFLIDPVDGTYNFARGVPNYSITLAYQKLEQGKWKTMVGMVFDPQTRLCTFADETTAYIATYISPDNFEWFNKSLTIFEVPQEPAGEAFTGGFQERLAGKDIEVAVYKSGASPVNQLRDRLLKKLGDEGTLKRTYSSAQVVSAMAYLGTPEAVILGADSLKYAWDVDAALHIAEKAGAAMRKVRIMDEDFVLLARSEPTLSALQAMVEREAQLIPSTGRA